MNALKTLDVYLSRPPTPSQNGSSASSPSSSPSRISKPLHVPDVVLDTTQSLPTSPDTTTSQVPMRGRMLRKVTPMPLPSNGARKVKKRRRIGETSAEKKERHERKRRRMVYQSEGWLGGAYVAVLALWTSLWVAVFGDYGGLGKEAQINRALHGPGSGEGEKVIEELDETKHKLLEGSASESETSDTPGDEPGKSLPDLPIDPVTRPPATEDELLKQAAEADTPPPPSVNNRVVAARNRSLPDPVSFKLRSSSPTSLPGEPGTSQRYESGLSGNGGILTNASGLSDRSDIQVLHYASPSRRTKLLPNPLSPTLLTPNRRDAKVDISVTTRTEMPPRTTSIPRTLSTTPFHLPKTLILDLDETLIHSTSRPMLIQSSGVGGGGGLVGINLSGLFSSNHRRGGGGGRGEGHTVEVVLGGRSTLYHVYKRPFVDHFLKKVSSWYTLVIFTASMQEYADPVIDWLDGGRGLFGKKLYRDSCSLQPNGSYIKDLTLVEPDLSRVCFMDNSPVSYNWNKANALPIEGWTSDPNDKALLDALPVLDSLRFTSDVRRVLGIRGF